VVLKKNEMLFLNLTTYKLIKLLKYSTQQPKMETIFVLNLSQGNFFRYTKKNNEDKGYNRIILEFTTPQKKNLIEETVGLSYWEKTDKIVFVPKHLMDYTEKKYMETYV
jgi:hypothetical protein